MRTTHRLAALCALVLFLTGCGQHVPFRIDANYAVGDDQFKRVMGLMLGPPLVGGNTVTTLQNGDQIFPSMLDAIRAAQKTIDFETYIYWSGHVGDQFAKALSERARAGVKCHVTVDAVGGDKMSQSNLDLMSNAGVELEHYHRIHWYDLSSAKKLDNRTHRKILVVDGTVGFIGGVGIADQWDGNADSPEHWRDTHYRVTGPVVSQLQAAFLDDWLEVNGHVLDGEDYFRPLKASGDQSAQVFLSSPAGGAESMRLMFLLSVAASRKELLLESAYFVPDAQTIDALLQARHRGVAIRIIVPGPHIDTKTVRRASRAKWGDLLRDGVEIFEYQPTMFHCKLLVADAQWVSVGSANLDNRSFSLNTEANLNVLDAKFAQAQKQFFEDDVAHSKQITYDEWRSRPFFEKLAETLASILSPEL